MGQTRTEVDSLGNVEVPVERLWGAQTQRSLDNFPIGNHPMPRPVIEAMVLIKRAAAVLNKKRGALDTDRSHAIVTACDEVLQGKHWAEFPLAVWQTGSGTHTNMNVNEVVANRACELMGGARGAKAPVHPNDHVNMAQSSNDAFSAAIYIAGALQIRVRLLPAAAALSKAFSAHAVAWRHVPKVGRTHLMDATPLTFGHEASAWAAQIEDAGKDIEHASLRLTQLALGATAVGTGINAPSGWGDDIARELSSLTGVAFVSAANKFAAISSHDGLLSVMGAFATLAAALTKVANDVRLLASGPRCGIGELTLPANEPGSSIMPGKVNPSQAEALLMVCARVVGNHASAFVGASSGLFQLNVAKPLLALCLLESCALMTDAMDSFRLRCVDGLRVNEQVVAQHLSATLMTATALAPTIGYDIAASVAKYAFENGLTIREAALARSGLSAEAIDELLATALPSG